MDGSRDRRIRWTCEGEFVVKSRSWREIYREVRAEEDDRDSVPPAAPLIKSSLDDDFAFLGNIANDTRASRRSESRSRSPFSTRSGERDKSGKWLRESSYKKSWDRSLERSRTEVKKSRSAVLKKDITRSLQKEARSRSHSLNVWPCSTRIKRESEAKIPQTIGQFAAESVSQHIQQLLDNLHDTRPSLRHIKGYASADGAVVERGSGAGKDGRPRAGVYSSPMPMFKDSRGLQDRVEMQKDTLYSRSGQQRRDRDRVSNFYRGEDLWLSTRERINLLQKHSKHLTDLRAYHEDEVRELRKALTNSLDSSGQLGTVDRDASMSLQSAVQGQLLAAENKHLLDKCRTMEEELEELYARVRTLEQKNLSLEQRTSEYVAALSGSQTMAIQHQAHFEELQRYCRERGDIVADLESKVASLEDSVKIYKKSLDEELELHRQDKMALQRILVKHDALEKNYKFLQETMSITENRLFETRTEIVELNRTISKVELKNKRIGRENDNLLRNITQCLKQEKTNGDLKHLPTCDITHQVRGKCPLGALSKANLPESDNSDSSPLLKGKRELFNLRDMMRSAVAAKPSASPPPEPKLQKKFYWSERPSSKDDYHPDLSLARSLKEEAATNSHSTVPKYSSNPRESTSAESGERSSKKSYSGKPDRDDRAKDMSDQKQRVAREKTEDNGNERAVTPARTCPSVNSEAFDSPTRSDISIIYERKSALSTNKKSDSWSYKAQPSTMRRENQPREESRGAANSDMEYAHDTELVTMANANPNTNDEVHVCLHEILRNSKCESLAVTEEKLLAFLNNTPSDVLQIAMNKQTDYGYTPLLELLSCPEPSVELLCILTEHGCNVNVADGLEISPLQKATAKLFIIPRILGGDFLCPEEKQIVECQIYSDKEVFEQLINSGADVNKSDIFGRNPLFVSNDVEIIGQCVANGADVNVRDTWGRTLLHSAITMPNYQQLVKFYIPILKPDMIKAADIYGSTALHYAALFGRCDIKDELLKYGVDPNAQDINGKGYFDLLKAINDDRKLKKQNEVHFNDVMCTEELSNIVYKPTNEALCLLLNDSSYGGSRDEHESRDIKDTIVKFAQNICTLIGNLDTRFRCTLFRTGSSEEGTKVGDPNEFDFVFCLDAFAEMCDIEEIPEQKGFAELKARGEIPLEFSNFFDANKKCSAPEVRRVFGELLRRTVVNKTTWSSGKMYFDGDIRHFEEYDRPVFTLKVRWVGCSYKDEEISIDLVPAVRKHGWWPSNTDFASIDMMTEIIRSEGCLLLLQNPYEQSDTEMRISCSAADICLMKSLPQKFRESYRLCKLLRHKDIMPQIDPDATDDYFPLFEASDCVTSYMLKNSLFHVLGQCKADGLMSDVEGQGSARDIVNISIRILTFFDECCCREKLPVYFLPNREDIFLFQFLGDSESLVRTLNPFHCERRHAFVKIMLYILSRNA